MTFDDCRDPACTEHPHCVCGVRLGDDGSDVLACPECGTGVLAGSGNRERAEVPR